MDFIASMLKVKGYDPIYVVVDRFSKQTRFTPTSFSDEAECTAKFFFDYWISQKGYSKSIVLDRDVQFQCAF